MIRQNTYNSLVKKLSPHRFPKMSGKMTAIVGYILDQEWTDPAIGSLLITSDNAVLAQECGDVGYNGFIGTAPDLKRNWMELLEAAGLTKAERSAAEFLFLTKVHECRN